MKYTQEDIAFKVRLLRETLDELATLSSMLNAAASGNYSSAELKNLITAHPALSLSTTPEKLRKLSQERAETIYTDCEASERAAALSTSRARWLLLFRKAIYPDTEIQKRINDINIHITMSAELCQRSYGFLPAAQSFDLVKEEKRSGSIKEKIESTSAENTRTNQVLLQLVQKGPMQEPVVKEGHSKAPALPDGVDGTSGAFGKLSLDIAEQYLSIIQRSKERLINTIGYLYLIDNHLIPEGLDEKEGWEQDKADKIADTQNGWQVIKNFSERTRFYLEEAALFCEPAV